MGVTHTHTDPSLNRYCDVFVTLGQLIRVKRTWPDQKNSDKDNDSEEGSDKDKDKDNFVIFKIFPEIV